jgi:hypothetical protein
LDSVTIPNSVTTVGSAAFFECGSLTSVIIGNSVTTIGINVFAYCTDLSSVTNESLVPQNIESNVFSEVNKSACTLRVPAGAKAAYQSAAGWNEFMNIVEI